MITTTTILWFVSLLAGLFSIAASIAKLKDRSRQRLRPTRGEYKGTVDPIESLPTRQAPLLAGRRMEKVARYADIAHLIQSGDLISFSGRTLFAYAIRCFTYSDKSHVGIAVVDDEGLWIVDSCEGLGVTKRLLFDDIKRYCGQYYWHPIRAGMKHFYKREKCTKLAMDSVRANVKYGWAGIVLQFILHAPVLRTLAYLVGFASCKRFTERPFCSMAVTQWMRGAALDPVPGRDPQLVVPQDLNQSLAFEEGIALLP